MCGNGDTLVLRADVRILAFRAGRLAVAYQPYTSKHRETAMTDPSAKPGMKSTLWAAVTTSVVHGLIWLPALIWLVVYLPRAGRLLTGLDVKLPWVTEVVLNCSRAVIDWPVACAIGWIAFVAADCWILRRLSRPTGYR